MAKLYFSYSAMNAGKSTILLQASHNYRERGMNTMLLTFSQDGAPARKIRSRIGLEAAAHGFNQQSDIAGMITARHQEKPLDCVMIDEAQFLTQEQVWQLAGFADGTDVPVMCYGLRTDFQGKLFTGSLCLLAIADTLREIRTICHCGRKATMVARMDESGGFLTEGEQIDLGGDDRYVSLCRFHWAKATGKH